VARAFGTRLSVAGRQFSVFGSDVADFFAKKKTGQAARLAICIFDAE
jgi:nitrate/nitrite transporter NarK